MDIKPLEISLIDALSSIEPFHHCALLDYPDHLNSGDHLIWLGTCLYLVETRQAKITYTSSLVDFDQDTLRKKNGNAPIFLQGGGNFGDIWPDSQKFREQVIQNNHDCPIYIMPQSILFSDETALKNARGVLNAHPNLTIFARDKFSFEIACENFHKARTILAPDMVFMLAPILREFFKREKTEALKFLFRADKEISNSPLREKITRLASEFPNSVIEDWEPYKWLYDGRGKLKELPTIYKKLPGSVFAVREIWQRGIAKPHRLPSRLKWRFLKRFEPILNAMPNRAQTLFSWMIAYDAASQIAECDLLVTDRLHAHMTASILGVKNGLIANSYHKNEQYFSTWQMAHRNSTFLKQAEDIDEFVNRK